MSYKRLRQGGIKNAYFRIVFRQRLEKKTWQISLIKRWFFTGSNLIFYYCKLTSIQIGRLVSCIQMDADANEHRPE